MVQKKEKPTIDELAERKIADIEKMADEEITHLLRQDNYLANYENDKQKHEEMAKLKLNYFAFENNMRVRLSEFIDPVVNK